MRYYFHLRDSAQCIPDDEGTEIPSLHDAHGEIQRVIEELRQENPDIARAATGWRVDVSDSSGTVLLSISLD
jgi:hypothetical protein